MNYTAKKNYSLDSDEEEDVRSKKLDVNDIDGQEDTTMVSSLGKNLGICMWKFNNVQFFSMQLYNYKCINIPPPSLQNILQRRDGEQVITPFNLDDENEEGHFDENGNFIFDKKASEEIRDSWLDSIDMQKVRHISLFSHSLI